MDDYELEVAVPQCAVCRRPVESLEWFIEPWGEYVYIARCHGSEERTVFDRSDLEDGPIKLFGGVAFRGEANDQPMLEDTRERSTETEVLSSSSRNSYLLASRWRQGTLFAPTSKD